MTRLLVAVDEPAGAVLAEQLTRAGMSVHAVVEAATPARSGAAALSESVQVLVLHVTRDTLDAALVAACDRAGVRILPLCPTEADERVAAAFGLDPVLPDDADGWQIAHALRQTASGPAALADPAPAPASGTSRVITVWGAAGAPGRSTIAVELAAELSRGGRRVCLADADTHAPALALLLGLADEGPGLATACRQSDRSALGTADLMRISTPTSIGDGRLEVLPGINRPARWPELSGQRMTDTLTACRGWVEHTVVDVSSSLEQDEEIVSDLTDGPRRNAATLAALRAADQIVAVVAADPLGIARFLRAHAELRRVVGATPVSVLANRLRPGTLGIDARGQVRRTLERFAGVRDVWFAPADPRSVDAAVLAARPVAEVAPRSPLTLAVRRFAGEAVAPPVPVRAPSRRAPRRRVRAAVEQPATP